MGERVKVALPYGIQVGTEAENDYADDGMENSAKDLSGLSLQNFGKARSTYWKGAFPRPSERVTRSISCLFLCGGKRGFERKGALLASEVGSWDASETRGL